jgi:hypothetical protein
MPRGSMAARERVEREGPSHRAMTTATQPNRAYDLRGRLLSAIPTVARETNSRLRIETRQFVLDGDVSLYVGSWGQMAALAISSERHRMATFNAQAMSRGCTAARSKDLPPSPDNNDQLSMSLRQRERIVSRA